MPRDAQQRPAGLVGARQRGRVVADVADGASVGIVRRQVETERVDRWTDSRVRWALDAKYVYQQREIMGPGGASYAPVGIVYTDPF